MQRFTCHQLVPWDVLVGKFASLAVYVGIFDLFAACCFREGVLPTVVVVTVKSARCTLTCKGPLSDRTYQK
ncbi:hypothetical protein COCSUDRAFT_33156 [Coccomyxa subellipsoidea C-169]|uniref:Uncharacterized protein n=1 Tax=Coccomyxa subellipsoidea (strain C-169) TaxID=574566 RepID=I0YZ46_COCSC|nr:hypothetical protein COCSUDRAFT_33156 [Coccomyxa subellipsoidea C-169]EIE23665.1 hypothetical protein COCSUDRAFT_33156 [Coccomyxa subellipsoidea C-169]|eukprot:XP_005648209.1 hypothetical protein COCSUDRAFT_33156 [Coccomyxa subellipsoidea C-169]